MKPALVIRPSKAPILVKVAAVSAAVASLGLALYGEPVLHLTIPFFIAVLTPFAATAIAVVTLARSSPNRLQQGRHCLLALSVGMVALVVFQFPALPISMIVHDRDLARTRVWCDHLITELEQWRSDHGTYPESLEATSLVVDPPNRWQRGGRYRFEDGEFELTYSTGESRDGYTYHSLGKSWH